MTSIRDIEVIAPNFKKRLSGVTSTIIQLVPEQNELGIKIASIGPGLPENHPRIRYWQLPGLIFRPAGGQVRVWHARRNVEMIAGLVLKHIFRAPLKLVFTSASQRHHTATTKWLIRKMDSVIATSKKTGAYLEVPHTVIMHGIDTERFSPVEDKAALKEELGFDPNVKIAGCFGRVRHQKGTDLFVDAMIRLLPSHPDWIGIIAGRTTAEHSGFEAELRERIAEAGLTDRIRFVGEHTDIERWYQILSLFIGPQRWEGFGLTPLEAMACGIPVVATDVGAFSELIVEGETGSVVAIEDLDAMIDASDSLMHDTARRQAASEASIKHVHENYPLQREAQNIISVYEKMMDRPSDDSLAKAA